MKKRKLNKLIIACLGLLLFALPVRAQEEEPEEPEATEQVIRLRYFSQANSLQWLQVESQFKTGKKYETRPNATVRVYLDSLSDETLLAKTNTGSSGKTRVTLPPQLKERWDASGTHEFIVMEDPASEDGEESEYSLEVQKGKIVIDTTSDEETRNITVTVTKLENGEWVPAPEVEMKIGVERLGGILTAGEDETYTTDSSGIITVEFIHKELPGDEKGLISLVARVDDNEMLGNMLVKTSAPWGVATTADDSFFEQRSLWARSSKAPYWLMFLAYGIIAGVWGTLLYLVFQLVKVIRMGKTSRA